MQFRPVVQTAMSRQNEFKQFKQSDQILKNRQIERESIRTWMWLSGTLTGHVMPTSLQMSKSTAEASENTKLMGQLTMAECNAKNLYGDGQRVASNNVLCGSASEGHFQGLARDG